MASSHPVERGAAYPATPWYVASSTCNRSYLVAALRAAAIAVVLLGILVLLVVL